MKLQSGSSYTHAQNLLESMFLPPYEDMGRDLLDRTRSDVQVNRLNYEKHPVFRVRGNGAALTGGRTVDAYDYLMAARVQDSSTVHIISCSTNDVISRMKVDVTKPPAGSDRMKEVVVRLVDMVAEGTYKSINPLIHLGADMPLLTNFLWGKLRASALVYSIAPEMAVAISKPEAPQPDDPKDDHQPEPVKVEVHISFRVSSTSGQSSRGPSSHMVTQARGITLYRWHNYSMEDVLACIAANGAPITQDRCMSCKTSLATPYNKEVESGIGPSNILLAIIMRDIGLCGKCANDSMSAAAREEEYMQGGSIPVGDDF